MNDTRQTLQYELDAMLAEGFALCTEEIQGTHSHQALAFMHITPSGRTRALARRIPWSRRCIRDTPAWACRRYIPHEISPHRQPHQ